MRRSFILQVINRKRGESMYDQFVQLISTVGFPIAVSVFLLVRFERKIESLNKSVKDLTTVITTVIANQKNRE